MFFSFEDIDMEDLILFNSRGLIAGPEENETLFYRRCKEAKQIMTSCMQTLSKRLFDIDPDWVCIDYSNKGLRFWEGGCTWIENDKVRLQLSLRKRLGLYSREEILAHELVHASRNAFEEPIFEEILAYQTSKFAFRRFLGPFFRTPKEVFIFFFAFIVLFGFLMISPLTTYLGSFLLLGTGFLRLARAQSIFAKAKKKLANLVSPEKSLPVMIRLTDREIIRFSKMSEQEIALYAKKMSRSHLRWQQIFYSYFSPHSDKSIKAA